VAPVLAGHVERDRRVAVRAADGIIPLARRVGCRVSLCKRRLELNIAVKGKLLGLGVADRSRFEYRDREDREEVRRYRNKVTIKEAGYGEQSY
jgi:hypothetical protein